MIICACEDVDLADVLAAIDAGANTLDDVKRLTRAGMGYCQSLYCRDAILAHLKNGTPMRLRVPVRPLAMARLAILAADEIESSHET